MLPNNDWGTGAGKMETTREEDGRAERMREELRKEM